MLALGAALLSGCAAPGLRPALPDVPELTATPFFPQTEHDCGPAALATILGASGADATAAELIDAVYVEGLEGSLQAELLAATRRYGRLPVPVPPDPRGLLEEVAAGRPVLVLQNLGLKPAPRWHYAVVVGFDADAGRVVLRSGDERRRLERTARFLRSWRLAGHWGFVAVRPGEIPATAKPDRYMRAVVGSAQGLEPAATDAAYRAALGRWPEEPLVLFLGGVHEHAAGRRDAAVRLYRRALALDPGHVAARNNLAEALLEQGCRETALAHARTALADARAAGRFVEAAADTLGRVEAASNDGAAAARCADG